MRSNDVPGSQAGARSINPIAWIANGVAALVGRKKSPSNSGQRHGRGPYTAIVCSPSAEFAGHLAEALRGYREGGVQGDVTVNAEALNLFLDRAAAGRQTGDYAQAVRNYCLGISFLAAEFKRQGKNRPGRRS